MRFGVVLMPTDPVARTIERARELERMGYDHLWIYDHLAWQRFRNEPWHATSPLLSALAVSTDRIRLGTMVSNLNLRHPVTLAKDVMTIDHLSDGRFTLGLGAAGTGFDATILGQQPLTPVQRVDRLEEATVLLDGLLRGTVRNHRGEYYVADEARIVPGCVQSPRVPIAIGAAGRRALRITAERADMWITHGDTTGTDVTVDGTLRVVKDQSKRIDESLDAAGRDPAELARVYLFGHTDERALDSLAAFDDYVGRYEELGFTDIVFHDPRPDDAVWNEPVEVVDAIAEKYLCGG